MNRQRVVIFGSTGQLGTDLVAALDESSRFEVIPLAHEDADCTDRDAVRKALATSRPQIVINSAAFVRVDDCEDRADEAFRVNAIGAFNIGKSCAEHDALCVYISTDYVFDGMKESAYLESDRSNPINVYGASKLAGENLVRQAASRSLIVRMAGLYGKTGARGKGGNFVEAVIHRAKAGESLQIVNDVRTSPTYTADGARAIVRLLERDATGIFHVTNGGSCTWYEFATAALSIVGLSASVNAVSSKNYAAQATRPRNSSLASEKLESFAVRLRPWRAALGAYLHEKGHISTPLSTAPTQAL
jgi:dTDP-4-dehydrorhamnose reductase